MIDEKLLIKELKKMQGKDLMSMFIDDVIKVIKRQPKVSAEEIDEVYLQVVKENNELKARLAKDWIPVSEKPPEDDKFILVSFENYSLPDIARYETDKHGGAFYPGDMEESYISYGLFVNAWQPLPKSYRPKENIEEASNPCHGCFGAASNDCQGCWKKSMLNTFLGKET